MKADDQAVLDSLLICSVIFVSKVEAPEALDEFNIINDCRDSLSTFRFWKDNKRANDDDERKGFMLSLNVLPR